MKPIVRNLGSLAALTALCLLVSGCPDVVPGPGTEGTALEIIDAALAAEQVEDGIAYLMAGDWESAYDSFSQAVINDYTNGEAIAYYTVCDIASISADEALQTLAGDMLGIESYPATMNEALAPDWMTGEFTDGIDLFTGVPDIVIPAEIAGWEDDNVEIITIGEYFLALAYNAVSYLADNGGLNALYDTLVDLLGPRLDNAIAAIRGLPNGAQIVFTYDMFSADELVPSWWPLDGIGDPLEIVIGKAEILAEAYYLQALKASLYMTRAYNFTLPLMDYWDNFNPVDNDYVISPPTPVNGWSDVPSPFTTEFLYARGDAAVSLQIAKSAVQGALGTLQEIVNLIQGRGTGSGFTIAEDSPLAEIASSWDYVETMLDFAEVMLGKMLASINKPTVTFIYPVDMSAFVDEDGYFDVFAYCDYYSVPANWPTVVDWGTVNETEGYLENPPTAIGINLSAVYTSPICAINNLIALDSRGEPQWYKFAFGEAGLSRVSPSPVFSIGELEATSGNYDYLYGFKIKDLTLNGLVKVDDEMYEYLKEMILTTIAGAEYDESDFIIENNDGSIEVFIPIVQPYLAYHSFAPADQQVTVTDLGLEMVTTGSFWFALQYQNFYYYEPPATAM